MSLKLPYNYRSIEDTAISTVLQEEYENDNEISVQKCISTCMHAPFYLMDDFAISYMKHMLLEKGDLTLREFIGKLSLDTVTFCLPKNNPLRAEFFMINAIDDIMLITLIAKDYDTAGIHVPLDVPTKEMGENYDLTFWSFISASAIMMSFLNEYTPKKLASIEHRIHRQSDKKREVRHRELLNHVRTYTSEYKGGHHKSPKEHWRKGHYRYYESGPIWIKPKLINKGVA